MNPELLKKDQPCDAGLTNEERAIVDECIAEWEQSEKRCHCGRLIPCEYEQCAVCYEREE